MISVELLGVYSKPAYQPVRLRKLVEMMTSLQVRKVEDETTSLPQVHKLSQRLAPGVAEELAEAYRVGASTTELGPRFGLSHGSVLRLLAEQGVEMRRQGLSESDARTAARMYQDEGLSLAEIGTQFGVWPGTVRRALLKAGVWMRPAGGSRPRK